MERFEINEQTKLIRVMTGRRRWLRKNILCSFSIQRNVYYKRLGY